VTGATFEIIIRALPYPEQMRNIEIAADYVEFMWRGTRYRITESLRVDEIGDGVLVGSDRAILMQACIERICASGAIRETGRFQ